MLAAAIAVVNSYFAAFVSGQLPSKSTHAVLLGGAISAEALLAIGIWLESPKSKTFREWLGLAFVFGGAIVSAAFTIGLFIFDEGVSGAQQDKIIALETRLAPRILTPMQMDALTKAMSAFPHVPFDVAMDEDADSRHLMGQLVTALAAASWTLETWTGPPPGEEMRVGPNREIKLAFMPLDGMQIWYDASHEKDFGPAAKEFISALGKDGIPVTTNGGTHLADVGADLVHLFIGEKKQ